MVARRLYWSASTHATLKKRRYLLHLNRIQKSGINIQSLSLIYYFLKGLGIVCSKYQLNFLLYFKLIQTNINYRESLMHIDAGTIFKLGYSVQDSLRRFYALEELKLSRKGYTQSSWSTLQNTFIKKNRISYSITNLLPDMPAASYSSVLVDYKLGVIVVIKKVSHRFNHPRQSMMFNSHLRLTSWRYNI